MDTVGSSSARELKRRRGCLAHCLHRHSDHELYNPACTTTTTTTTTITTIITTTTTSTSTSARQRGLNALNALNALEASRLLPFFLGQLTTRLLARSGMNRLSDLSASPISCLE